MNLLEGKKVAETIKEELKLKVDKIKNTSHRTPHLKAVLVGNNGASLTYVNNKITACKKVGIRSTLTQFESDITENSLLEEIKKINEDNDIDGYIVQLPLPKHIDEQKVINEISPQKDVDGFHPSNFGKMALGMPTFIPATPLGIIELLDRYKIDTSSKQCVVLGRSHIVGRPISILMSQKGKNSTVTVAHSKTTNLQELTKQADIIISALGIPEFIKDDMVKEGVVVIDVGITRVTDKTKLKGYSLKGDVDFEAVSKKASYITPVPGGVGPMTIVMLLYNTIRAWELNQKSNA